MIRWVRRERTRLLTTLVVSTLIVAGIDWYERDQTDSLWIRSPRLRFVVSDSLVTVADHEGGPFFVNEFVYQHGYNKEWFPEPERWLQFGRGKQAFRLGMWHDMTFAASGIAIMRRGYFQGSSKGPPMGWVFKIPIAGLVVPIWMFVTATVQIILLGARKVRRWRLATTRGFPVVPTPPADLSQEIVRKIQ